MTEKRTVHVEVDGNTFVNMEGIQSGLSRLCKLAEDSNYLEDLFSKSIQHIYTTLLNGEINYSGENPKIGHVWLGRFNNIKGNINIEYNPSGEYRIKWSYFQKTIGIINMRDNTFLVEWDNKYDEDYHQIPKSLMEDTEKVMGILGLKRKP